MRPGRRTIEIGLQGLTHGVHPALHISLRINGANTLGVQQFLLAAKQFLPASLMFALFSILKSTERGSRLQEFRRIGQKRAASRTFPSLSLSTIVPSRLHPVY
ncbi:hypothetical protein LWV33_00975 [Brucella intermedia]